MIIKKVAKPYYVRVLRLLHLLKVSKVKELDANLSISSKNMRRYLKKLEKLSLVKVIGNKVSLTDEGKETALTINLVKKALEERNSSKPFYFHKGINNPLILATKDLLQLYVVLKHGLVDDESLKFVVRNGYLQKWLNDVFGLKELASFIDSLKNEDVEKLRTRLVQELEEYLKLVR